MNNNYIKIYGYHANIHALANINRNTTEIYLTKNAMVKITSYSTIDLSKFKVNMVDTKTLNKLLPNGQVHQGIISFCKPKQILPLKESNIASTNRIVFLDNITDPRNIGAIIRTCSAYGINKLITTQKFDLLDEGLIAKSASGGLEYVDIIIAKNLANCYEELKSNNFWLIGFDSDANYIIDEINFNKRDKVVAIFGDEGRGIRNLTRKYCDQIYKINAPGKIKSLNVSVAMGIILDKIAIK